MDTKKLKDAIRGAAEQICSDYGMDQDSPEDNLNTEREVGATIEKWLADIINGATGGETVKEPDARPPISPATMKGLGFTSFPGSVGSALRWEREFRGRTLDYVESRPSAEGLFGRIWDHGYQEGRRSLKDDVRKLLSL